MTEAAQIYFAPTSCVPSTEIHIPAMGIHELMPPGFIHHGGVDSRYPCLIMVFHSPAQTQTPQGWVPVRGQMVIWDFDAEHHYGNSDASWDHSWIQISGKSMSRLLRNNAIPFGIPLNLGDLPMRYLAMMCEELRNRTQQDPDMLEGLLQIFWHDLTRHWNSDPHVRPPDSRLDRARNFIETNFAQPFDLSQAAAQAHLSPSHFCYVFSKRFGLPPREYAMQLRLQRSTQLLANHELAVFQVAEMVGCPDALYFSKLFRRRYGISPRQFRHQQETRLPSPQTAPNWKNKAPRKR